MPFLESTHPLVSVVVPTCNRPDDVRRCLESLTRVVYPRWDVLLVDQSGDDRTRIVAESLAVDLPNLRYHRIGEKGAARARNAGIEATGGEIIAFIDDDCTVRADWLEQVAGVLQRHPQAGVVFGAVDSMIHDPQEYYVTVYKPSKEHFVRGRTGFLHTQGLSANMYLLRDAVQQVGLFDTCLGPGSRIFTGGGEDNDYLYRCLAADLGVVYTPHVSVEHHGARDYKSGAVARLFRSYAFCSGAADMKLLRCGEFAALVLIAVHGLYCLTRINLPNLLLRRGPSNLEWITMYVRGLCASFQLRVDRQRRLYMP